MMFTLNDVPKRWLRFLVGGMINTTFSYAIFLFLTNFFIYHLAYLIAFSLGIFFAYFVNAIYVFKIPPSWKGILSYPILYILQYLFSALLLGVLVEIFSVNFRIAPIIVILSQIPLSYVMNLFIMDNAEKH
jgi:putative flippase GtrA